MKDLLTFLDGKKTYLLAIVGCVYVFGGDQGWWQLNDAILGILGFGGMAFLRAGVRKAAGFEETNKDLPGPSIKLNLLALPLAGLLLLCSCASLGKVDWAATAANIAGLAADTGAREDLKANPSHRPLYAACKGALDRLVRDAQWDPVEFQKTLRLLPVQAFQGGYGVLLTGSLVQVFDAATSELYLVQSAPALEKLITSVRDGLARALAAPLLPAARAAPATEPQPIEVKRIRIL